MAVNACGACHSNGIAFLHGIPDIDQKGRVVRIKGSETVAMVNYNIIAKPVMVSGGNHCAARGSHYGDNAASGGDVDALVLPSVTDGGAAGGVELSRDDCAFHRVAHRDIVMFRKGLCYVCCDILERVSGFVQQNARLWRLRVRNCPKPP